MTHLFTGHSYNHSLHGQLFIQMRLNKTAAPNKPPARLDGIAQGCAGAMCLEA